VHCFDNRLFDHAPIHVQGKHVHSSGVIELPNGDLLACWFHGSGEGTAGDVVIQGARLRKGQRKWSPVYGALVFGSRSNQSIHSFGGYEPLVAEIVHFFKTGKPPVSAEETLALFAFMEAADESKRQGGLPVTLERVMVKARAVVSARHCQSILDIIGYTRYPRFVPCPLAVC